MKLYGTDTDTFAVLENGLIFLVSSVDELSDAERVDRLPADAEQVDMALGIEIPEWIFEETVFSITSRRGEYWNLTTAKTLAGAKRMATREYGAGYTDDVLLVGETDGHGRTATVARKNNYPGSLWRRA